MTISTFLNRDFTVGELRDAFLPVAKNLSLKEESFHKDDTVASGYVIFSGSDLFIRLLVDRLQPFIEFAPLSDSNENWYDFPIVIDYLEGNLKFEDRTIGFQLNYLVENYIQISRLFLGSFEKTKVKLDELREQRSRHMFTNSDELR